MATNHRVTRGYGGYPFRVEVGGLVTVEYRMTAATVEVKAAKK